MAAGRGRVLQRLDRLLEPREDVRLADRLEPGDPALQVLDPTERLGPDDPMGLLVERHDAQLVALREGGRGAQDRLLADVDLADAVDADPAAPWPPLNELQWQASIEPDWSMTTTSATSGCF